jgi:hypothetical protein
MKKTLIAVALTMMFVSPMAFAVEDVCAKNPTHPLCNPTPTPTPTTPPITVSPVTTVSPVIAPVIAPYIGNDNANYNNNSNLNLNTANGGQGGEGGAAWSGANANATAHGGTVAFSGNSQNSGNNTGTSTVVVQGDQAQERNPVSTAAAPTVITGSDQCLVPVAVGGQGIGFGLSIGVAVRDANCEVLKLSRQIEYLVGKDAAVKFLRMNDPRVEALMQSLGK